MKYILKLLLTFSICLNIVKGQDVEPSQRKFYLNGDSIYISSELDDFKISNFTLGWHWGDQYKISQALQMNQKDIYSRSTENINSDTKLFIRTNYSKTDNNRVLKQ